MRPLELAQRYMDIFFSGEDVEQLYDLFSDHFSFTGPFDRFESAEGYISALKSDQPEELHYDLLMSFEDDATACLIYQFSKPGISTPMAQLFEVKEGRIFRILLIFDTGEFT